MLSTAWLGWHKARQEMRRALLWEAELREGQADGQCCSWVASLLGAITNRQQHCWASGIPVHASEVKNDTYRAPTPALLCEWQWGLWTAQQVQFPFSSSVQNWVAQFSCPLPFRAQSPQEPGTDCLTPSNHQGLPFQSFLLISVLFTSPPPNEPALWSKGSSSSFSSSTCGPPLGWKGRLMWQESDRKILQTATTSAKQVTSFPRGQNTHGGAPTPAPEEEKRFCQFTVPWPDQSCLGQVDTDPTKKGSHRGTTHGIKPWGNILCHLPQGGSLYPCHHHGWGWWLVWSSEIVSVSSCGLSRSFLSSLYSLTKSSPAPHLNT